ncbi:replication initiation protein [Clostridium sp. B9]|uniref:replication initiation protein n=1 Tax=Clostridium sp. B9 TaxID=3423224 RepID=UPI003D2F3A7C
MEKNYLVTNSSYFIMNSNYDLSLEEQKIILALASTVKPNDEDFKSYTFKISYFIELLDIETKSKYTNILKITKELMKKVFEIKEENKLIQISWLSSVTYEEDNELLELEFSPKLKSYMLQLKEKFTKYKSANILCMKSKYSPRVYELLKCNKFEKKGFIEIEVDELRKILKTEDIYPLYADFKRYIIIRTQRELMKLSDISFDFEEVKTGRKVTSIIFFICSYNLKDKK